MFHPVGPQSPSVYWRRRLVLLATIVIVIMLIALTARAAISGGNGSSPSASGPTGPSHRPSAPSSTSASKHPPRTRTSSRSSRRLTSQLRTSSASSSRPGRPHRHRPGTATTSTSVPPPPACSAHDLAVQAVVGQNTYHVGDSPVVMMQVTNTGSGPCVEDLSDKQIVLKVYNGESRVWGSHDCQVMPGSNERVLSPDQPVRVSITWSGYTSEPGCKDRQRVGAGSYTLYAWLAGHEGKAASFAIS